MTAIVALKKDGEVWIGSDSRCLYNLEIAEAGSKKIAFFPNFAVAGTGLATVNIITNAFSDNKPFLRSKVAKMTSSYDASMFSLEIHKELKDWLMDAPCDPNSPDLSGEFIIATPTAIYKADSYGYSMEAEKFVCSGSGGPYMRGYLTQAIDSDLSGPELVKRALEVAIESNAGCGGELQIYKVCRETLPEAPPPAKKRKKKEKEVVDDAE